VGKFSPSETFKFTSSSIPTLKDDHVLVKTIYLSLDPAMRGWMNDVRSYLPPVQIGEVMRGSSVAQVVDSKSSKYSRGDLVFAPTGWQEYAALPDSMLEKIPPIKNMPLRLAHSLLGTTAMTAYFGFFDIGKPVPGETVVVSGAAGATGMIVGQLAKLAGCRVIGIAGGPTKCQRLVNEMGFDMALDYRSADFDKQLADATPAFIDVYFDNVGGHILNECLKRMAMRGRIVLCGGISQYNAVKPEGPSAYLSMVRMRGIMQGFIVFDYAHRYGEARAKISQWYAEGKIKGWVDVVQGLDKAPEGLLGLFEGRNTGKMVVQVSNDVQARL